MICDLPPLQQADFITAADTIPALLNSGVTVGPIALHSYNGRECWASTKLSTGEYVTISYDTEPTKAGPVIVRVWIGVAAQ